MKTEKPKHRAKYLFGLVAMMYPLLVFCALVVFHLHIRYLSIGIIIFGIAYSAFNAKQYRGKHTAALIISPLILIIIGSVSLLMGASFVIKFIKTLCPALANHSPDAISEFIMRLYPALADLSYVTIFVTSFFTPPPLAYYFIEIFDFKMKDKIPKEQFERCCSKATLVWIVFFLVDGIIAVITAFFAPLEFWTIYNVGISYVIMGIIFVCEFIVIKTIEKKCRLQRALTEETNANS